MKITKRVAILLTTAMGLLAPTLAATSSPAAAATCTDWAPLASSVTINQGLGSYQLLARGKTTIVRLFLTTPSCTTSSSEQITSATLAAYDGSVPAGTALVSGAGTSPASLNNAAIDTYGSSNPDGSGDPLFILKNFGASDSTGSVTFAITVNYRYELPGTTTWTPGTKVYSQTSSGGLLQASFAPAAQPIRILFVPMGDPSAPVCNEFPEAKWSCSAVNGEYADQMVQKAVDALARTMPVCDAETDLGSNATCGVKWRLDDTGMIDVGQDANGLHDMSSGALCISASNFAPVTTGPTIASQLSAYLRAWNSGVNRTTGLPNPHADRIVGLGWQGVTLGPPGCDEGIATLPSSTSDTDGDEIALRLVTDSTVNSTTYASDSGSTLAMELSHTWGSVPLSDIRDTQHDFHSGNINADQNSIPRAYNIQGNGTGVTKTLISDPTVTTNGAAVPTYDGYSVMHYTTGKNSNDNTVLEAPDYLFNQCALTPSFSAASCPAGTTPGLATVAAAGQFDISLSGTTDGTPGHSYFSSYVTSSSDENSQCSSYATPPTSGQQTCDALLEKDAHGVVLHTYGVPVHFRTSAHNDQTGQLVSTGEGTVDATVPGDPSMASFELWNGLPPTGAELYNAGTQAPPVVTPSYGTLSLGTPTDFTAKPTTNEYGTLSPDGRSVAWTDGTNLVVQARNADNSPGAVTLTVSGVNPSGSPSWSADGRHLTYADTKGDVYTVDLTAPQPAPGLVYNHLLQQLQAAASHPSYSSVDDQHLAMAAQGDIWDISIPTSGPATGNPVICDFSAVSGQQPTATPTCTPLATDGSDSAPSWGGMGGTTQGLVAYNNGSGVNTVDPTQPASSRVTRLSSAADPSWGGNLLVFRGTGSSNNGLWLAQTTGRETGSYTNLTQLTSSADTAPSVSSATGTVAFSRLDSTNDYDVYDATLYPPSGTSTITFSATTANDATKLTADVYDGCAGTAVPAWAGTRPTSVSGQTATWSLAFPIQRGCPGSTVTARISDGFDVTSDVFIENIPPNGGGGPKQPPQPAIGAPEPGSTYLQYDAILVLGTNVGTSTGTNNPGVTTSWSLTWPSSSGCGTTPVGAGSGSFEMDPPPSGWSQSCTAGARGWYPGNYTLSETATDSSGQTGTTSVKFTVVADPSRTGNNINVTFDPQTLYVPSNGNDVTVTVAPWSSDPTVANELKGVTSSQVYVTEVGPDLLNGTNGNQPPLPVDAASGTSGWTSNGNGTYTTKFVRSALTCAMDKYGLNQGYILVRITIAGNGFTLTGYDPVNPTVTPNPSPIAC